VLLAAIAAEARLALLGGAVALEEAHHGDGT